ncbi:hypothetical protein GWC95_13375 [Sediminibacterium roseum]|uniref:Uncharacterized protein n=1 Tax=Sediminibacterium roseum TaxID=1978412 RepID=A0ABX0A0G7_9BACT|nr:hypothetical protein [Sediminibacterium roseum]NCI50918.1 hypothetical protein [Sediminibacterium roseum]
MEITKDKEFIIVMKVGPFCGYGLDEIIQIKTNEENKVGVFYFGYGGAFCHPGKVRRFVDQAQKQGAATIKLLFITTKSDFSSALLKSEFLSENGYDWVNLHPEVLLVGSKFAFVAKGLKEVNYDLDLSQYRSMLGQRKGKYLNEHLRFRADKSCAQYEPRDCPPAPARIEYESELVFPYCVLVK